MAAPTTLIPGLPTGVPVQPPQVTYATDGAITLTAGGIALLTKGSAGAYTLAAPTGDPCWLVIIAGTAQAHVVTIPTAAAAGGAGQDVLTFGGTINDSIHLFGIGGLWYIGGGPRNVTAG
jgi:hypothetical protein